ncbi:MAG: chloride channel protein [Phycisphaeraceae bacterium]
MIDLIQRLRKLIPGTSRGIMLAPIVGIVAGLGAILFHVMCLLITHASLEYLVGYHQGGPANEVEYAELFGNSLGNGIFRPWMLLVIPTIGGLISGWIVFRFAPEAEGHGTDAAIHAYHHKGGLVRGRVPIVKMLTSAITLGTGGSGGREGPIAQIGAGIGSFLATKLRLPDSERRVLMSAGLGAGIGAIFHAPLAGAIFSVEVLYRDPDFESEALIPAFISTTIAYCVFCLAFGFQPLFEVQAIRFNQPSLLLPLTVLAGVSVVASWTYIRCFYGVTGLFKRWSIPNFLKPTIGAFATGLFALLLYYAFLSSGSEEAAHDSLSVLSFGYGFLKKVLAEPTGMTALLLLAVGFGKILTTSLTIGSGGSGGVFGPSMVIGGSLGAVVGLLFHEFAPGLVAEEQIAVFAILGMASFFAAAACTPLSTLIMVSEMTASYTLLLPSMWVCALAYLLNRNYTIYKEQVANRLESPAHRGDFIIDVLQGLTVRDAMHDAARDFITVPLDMPLVEMAHLIPKTRQSSFPVVDNEGRYYGLFGLYDIRQFLYESDPGSLAVAQDLAMPGVEPLTLQMDLSSAIGRFAFESYEELPVVDAEHPDKVLGLLRRQDLLATYNTRLLEQKKR